jgi:hypothetical protein
LSSWLGGKTAAEGFDQGDGGDGLLAAHRINHVAGFVFELKWRTHAHRRFRFRAGKTRGEAEASDEAKDSIHGFTLGWANGVDNVVGSSAASSPVDSVKFALTRRLVSGCAPGTAAL